MFMHRQQSLYANVYQNIRRFCKQNSIKGEKKRIHILERRYSIAFEKSACEKGIYI